MEAQPQFERRDNLPSRDQPAARFSFIAHRNVSRKGRSSHRQIDEQDAKPPQPQTLKTEKLANHPCSPAHTSPPEHHITPRLLPTPRIQRLMPLRSRPGKERIPNRSNPFRSRRLRIDVLHTIRLAWIRRKASPVRENEHRFFRPSIRT